MVTFIHSHENDSMYVLFLIYMIYFVIYEKLMNKGLHVTSGPSLIIYIMYILSYG